MLQIFQYISWYILHNILHGFSVASLFRFKITFFSTIKIQKHSAILMLHNFYKITINPDGKSMQNFIRRISKQSQKI